MRAGLKRSVQKGYRGNKKERSENPEWNPKAPPRRERRVASLAKDITLRARPERGTFELPLRNVLRSSIPPGFCRFQIRIQLRETDLRDSVIT